MIRAIAAFIATLCASAGCTALPPIEPSGCRSDTDCASDEICTIERACRRIETRSTREGVESSSGADGATGAPSTDADAGTARQPASTAGASGKGMMDPPRAGASPTNAVPLKALGAACDASSECAGNQCVDNVCCASPACTGACRRCGSQGQCELVTSGQDMDTCSGNASVCSSNGTCVSSMASGCAEDSQCSSGRCVLGALDGKCAELDARIERRDTSMRFGDDESRKHVAQTLTIESSGRLVEVRFATRCEIDGRYAVSIWELEGEGPVEGIQLAGAGGPEETRLDQAASWMGHKINFPVWVERGMRLGVVLYGNGGNCSIASADGNVYEGGDGYASTDGRAWQPLNKDFALMALVVDELPPWSAAQRAQ